MLRGIITGLVWGGLVGLVVISVASMVGGTVQLDELAGASQQGAQQVTAEAGGADAGAGDAQQGGDGPAREAPGAAQAPSPDAVPESLPESLSHSQPTRQTGEAAAPASAPIVGGPELPGGSAFNSERPETEPLMPATEAAPEAESSAMNSAPTREAAATADVQSADVPQTGAISAVAEAPSVEAAPRAPSPSEAPVATTSAPAQPEMQAGRQPEAQSVPETAPETAPEAAPETAPETAPEAAPETAPEMAAEAAPVAAPVAAPERAPQVAAVEGVEIAAPAPLAESAPLAQAPVAGGSPSQAPLAEPAPAAQVTAPKQPAPEVAPEAAPEAAPETAPEPSVETAAPAKPGGTIVGESPAPASDVPASDVPANDAPANDAGTGAAKTAIAALDQQEPAPSGLGQRVVPLTERSSASSSRLPTIGTRSATAPLPTTTQGDAPAAAAAPARASASGPAIDAFAAAFEAPAGKPLLAVVLIDTDPSPELAADLASLPFPVTFAVPAARANASDAAGIYRAAGREVALIVELPEGATAGDAAIMLEAAKRAVPEAVALMDVPTGNFQAARPVATQVVASAQESGHGMLTYARGLNAAEQVAQREGLPAALVFRVFDADGEDAGAIRRYFDRAAMRAGQQSGVVLVGHTSPEVLTALGEFALSQRASSITLAPLSAALKAGVQ